jgi:hypothetical protein
MALWNNKCPLPSRKAQQWNPIGRNNEPHNYAAATAREEYMNITKICSRVLLATALAGGLALAVGTPISAEPDYGNACHQRLENDRARIDHEAARHGNNSPQVAHAVDRMEADRQWCRDHHSDWDHTRFDVGVYVRP